MPLTVDVQRELQITLQHWLAELGPLVVMGIGNSLKGDDGAGPEIIGRLSARCSALQTSQPQVYLFDAGSAPENFLGKLLRLRPRAILLLDAAGLGMAPGACRLLRPTQLGAGVFATHNMPLSLFVKLLTSESNCEVMLLGLQPNSLRLGEGLSLEVQETIAAVVEIIAGAIEALSAGV